MNADKLCELSLNCANIHGNTSIKKLYCAVCSSFLFLQPTNPFSNENQ